jgi:hypothetical protein
MILTETTDKLSLITEQTGDVDVVVTYIDRVTSTGAVGAAGRQVTNITTVTTTDILAAPAADTTRKVESIVIRNAHATTSMDLRPQLDANGTLYELPAARLYPKDMWQWDEAKGFTKVGRDARFAFFGSTPADDQLSHTAVSSASSNPPVVMGCAPPPTPLSTRADRAFAMFSWAFFLGAATTTGCKMGHLDSANQINGIVAGIGNATNSATAATKMALSDTMSDNTLLAFGTSPTTVAASMILASGYAETSVQTKLESISLRFASEVAASQVSIVGGTYFQMSEDTEIVG